MTRRLLMVAAENDGLTGGKVGGIGDVVRDVPPALARLGWQVLVATPSYGFLHQTTGSIFAKSVVFPFGGSEFSADVYLVPGKKPHAGVTHYVFDHPTFKWVEGGRTHIYRNDPPDSPFASDASKYALFCAAVAEAIRDNLFQQLDCIHLHDWHAAFLLIIRKYHPRYVMLNQVRMAYTIHNLALQGVRPFAGHSSSLAAWYPDVPLNAYGELADPRWPNCLNPMAVGIRFADAVHTVSPSYAQEILKPSNTPAYYGGEGLEFDLASAGRDGRLFGILNGCEYHDDRAVTRLPLPELLKRLRSEVLGWVASQGMVSPSHVIALERLTALASASDMDIVLTSVSRVVGQKMFLLRERGSDGVSGLRGLLDTIGARGAYLFLGAGDRDYEQFLMSVSAQCPNFVFLNGFSDRCADTLYANGDLFIMPSSFEPCGISQMLAMRAGQPCLVHSVGGLRDTVTDGIDGFAFSGDTVAAQVGGFKEACRRAIDLKLTNKNAWNGLVERASGKRFLWDATVGQYSRNLYGSRDLTDVNAAQAGT